MMSRLRQGFGGMEKIRIHLLLVLALLPVCGSTVEFVVESLDPVSIATESQLREGDRLLSWHRPAQPQQLFHSPFDLWLLEINEGGTTPVNLVGSRSGSQQSWTLPVPDYAWSIRHRPTLPLPVLEHHTEARAALGRDDWEQADRNWRQAAITADDPVLAAWLLFKLGRELAAADQRELALLAFADATAAVELTAVVDAQNLIAMTHASWLARWHDDRVVALATALAARVEQDSLWQGRAWLVLGDYYRDSGKAALGLEWLEKAHRLIQTVHKDSRDEAKTALALADAVKISGKIDRANDLAQSSLRIWQSLVGEARVPFNVHYRLGSINRHSGNYETAIEHYQKAHDVARIHNNGRPIIATYPLNSLGLVAMRQGDMRAAERYFMEAQKQTLEIEPDGYNVAPSLMNLAYVLLDRGDLERSDRYARRAMEITRNHRPDSIWEAGGLNLLGMISSKRRDLDAALDYYQRALAVFLASGGDGGLDSAHYHHNIGNMLRRLKRYDESHQHALKAYELWAEGSPDSPLVGSGLEILGLIAQDRGDLKAAEEYLIRAQKILETTEPGSTSLASVVKGLSTVYRDRGELGRAAELIELAIEIYAAVAPGTENQGLALHVAGQIAELEGDLSLAVTRYCAATDSLDEQLTRIGGTLLERSTIGDVWSDIYQDCLRLRARTGALEEAFLVFERSRAQSILRLLAERDLELETDLPQSLQQQRKIQNTEIAEAYDRLEDLNLGQVEEISAERQKLQQLRENQRALDVKLRLLSPRLASLRQIEPLNLDQARRQLQPGDLFVGYSIGASHSFVMLLDADIDVTPKLVELDFSPADLDAQIGEFLALIQSASTTSTLEQKGAALYQTLIAPIEKELRDAERLIISTDSPMHRLPFAALGRQRAGRYEFLIERLQLVHARSLNLFSELKQTPTGTQPRSSGFVAFADPDYARTSDTTSRTFSPLPQTRTEALGIAKQFPSNSALYLGGEATENQARSMPLTTQFVHFAVHATLDRDFPLDSALVLTPPSGDGSTPQDDGRLQAWEIFQDIRLNADLVTLSACETALGSDAGGEGMIGLTRAFQFAGASSILASLWQVADDSTARLMEAFYIRLQAGEGKSQALRLAQLEMMRSSQGVTNSDQLRAVGGLVSDAPKSYAHPFHWAAFRLIGAAN